MTQLPKLYNCLYSLRQSRRLSGRSYDKGERIEDPTHVRALVDQKREAHRERATDHLAHAAPASQKLLVRAAERGANLGAITAALMRLLRRYGGAEL